jgi:hypothetical protein
MEAPFEGDQHPEEAMALYVDGLMRCLLQTVGHNRGALIVE